MRPAALRALLIYAHAPSPLSATAAARVTATTHLARAGRELRKGPYLVNLLPPPRMWAFFRRPTSAGHRGVPIYSGCLGRRHSLPPETTGCSNCGGTVREFQRASMHEGSRLMCWCWAGRGCASATSWHARLASSALVAASPGIASFLSFVGPPPPPPSLTRRDLPIQQVFPAPKNCHPHPYGIP